jgi:hypothetical protein
MLNIRICFYKTPALLAGVLFLSLASNSQETFVQNDFEHKINLYNVNGQPLENRDPHIAGTAFFVAAWQFGNLEFRKGHEQFTNIPLRFDLYNHQLHYRNPANEDLVLDPSNVYKFMIFDSTADRPKYYPFQNGFPAIEKLNDKSFYQVLARGPITMLKFINKSIYYEKDGLTGDIIREYRTYESYFFYTGNQMFRIKRDQGFVLNLMDKKSKEVGNFIRQAAFSFKSMDDIQQLVEYYNALFDPDPIP